MKEEIDAIKERNKRVELDKAWETSNLRRFIIALMTYIVVLIFLIVIKAANPWLTALIPTIGFILSTLTLPYFKKVWIDNVYKKK